MNKAALIQAFRYAIGAGSKAVAVRLADSDDNALIGLICDPAPAL